MLREDTNLNLLGDEPVVAPQPYPSDELVKPKKAIDEAYYTVESLGLEQEQTAQTFDRIYNNLTQAGYDDAVEETKAKFREEQDYQTELAMTNLIEDPNVPTQSKISILNNYTKFDLVTDDLRTKYAQDVAILDNSESYFEQDAQELYVDNLEYNLRQTQEQRDANDADDALEDIGGEIVSIANIVATSVAGIVDFGVRVYDAIKQKMDKGEVDWVENSTASERLDEGVLKGITEWKLDSVAEYMGIKEDFDTSYTNRTFGYIGEKLQALAEFAVEKGLFKNPEQAMFTMEAVGTLIPAGLATKKAIKSMRHTPGGGADVTTKANPKKAGDDLTKALTDDTDTKAKQMNTSKENIVAENVLPKANEVPDDLIPDLSKRLDKINDVSELNMRDRLVFETFFDDNIGRREQRFLDRNARIKVMEDSKLNVNVASSQIDMDVNSLSGRLVFGRTSDYPFTKKKDVIEAAERVSVLAKKSDEIELKKDRDLGIATKEKDIRSSVVVRDIDSKTEFTLDEFKKMKMDNRKFVVDYKFNKKYNFVADDMLGQKLNDSQVSLLGSKKIGEAVNNTILGEFAFGTGYTAKWFERAKAAVAGKAGRIKKEIQLDFKKKLDTNKKLRSEIADVVNMQAQLGVDIVDRATLKKTFRGYTEKQIDAIDETQRAFRKTQKLIHAVNNEAFRMELKRQGFNKGYFDPKTNEFKMAIRDVGKKNRKEFEGEGVRVYDPVKDEFIEFNLSDRLDGIYHSDGRKLVRMENHQVIKNRRGNQISDYALVKESDIDILPSKVLDELPGYIQREYKSKIFIEAIPKVMYINGKKVTDPNILRNYKETIGTAMTKTEADAVKTQAMKRLDDADNYEYSTRSSNLDNIRDVTDEYRDVKEVYQHTKTRNMDMEMGADVLADPLVAMEKAINRTVNTGAYSMYDKAFKKAFERDYKEVLGRNGGRYPENITDIAPRVEGDARLDALAKNARQMWRRQQHFQGNMNRMLDVPFQNALHTLADVFEKVKIPGISRTGSVIARDVGDLGLSGVNQKIMGYAGTLYITFSSPMRQLFIQPMMWLEQQFIYPKSFPKTVSRLPMHTIGLLHMDNPMLKGTYNAYLKRLNKADRADFLAEQAIMKRQGILESVNMNLALEETLKNRINKLDPKKIEKILEPGAKGYGDLKGVFNKYGFSNAELMNRVGLWLQNKYRWVDDPRNKGKNWADIKNAEDIAFEAWKQSGSMTRAGAVGMQRVPLLAFITQFQSIGLKSFMNVIQDNATNLTRADRVKLVATRMVMHGMEFGAPLAAGKYLLDYMAGHEDEEVRELADTISSGVIDNVWQGLTETDLSISESASVANVNFFGDVIEEMVNIGQIAMGSPDARAPNIPSVKAIGRTFEKLDDVKNMFIMNPVNAETLTKSVGKLFEITSAGNNAMRALQYYAAEQILTKDGRRRGISITGKEAFFKGVFGFNTEQEIDQYIARQLQRDEQDLIKDGIDDGYDIIMSNVKSEKDFAKVAPLINQYFSIMEQGGVFDTNQMLKIKQGIMSKMKGAYINNESYTLYKYIMVDLSGNKEKQRKAAFRLKDHPDPIIREGARKILGEKSQTNLMEQGN